MNNIGSNFNNQLEDNNSFDLKKEFFKYLFFWKYFVLLMLIFLSFAFVINRYSHRVFDTNSKIQILDKKQNNFEMPSAEDLFSNSQINLENEIEIITSSTILNEVIKNLNLNFYVEGVGDVMSARALAYPFNFKSKIFGDSITNSSFNLDLKEKGFSIINLTNDKNYFFEGVSSIGVKHDLPFEIYDIKKENWTENSYNLNFISNYDLINLLKKDIVLSQVGKNSEIINLQFLNRNPNYARIVLDEIINVFNKDGVRDRQLIHKRTIDFVNERYIYLASELESIELDKQTFKVNNNLVELTVNSEISLNKRSISEENIFSNENQIFIVSNLLEEILKLEFELLPSNIGIENIEINSIVQSYNDAFLEQKKLIISAGPNNPFVKQLQNSISNLKSNIISSLKNYLLQLNIINDKLTKKSNSILNIVADIPGQEKNLRSIERNQQIKEALYLFLLQKGEEAQVSYAITEPSIKVVEYSISSPQPVSPNTMLIYLGAILFALFIPFCILYFVFLFDTKIHSRDDIDNANLNVVGEIPFFDLDEKEKIFTNPNARSIISESFRMLLSNVRYLKRKDSVSNVILLTSSIKGEGKTLNALNLALSFSSVGMKVLLIGCDLRNPQLHKYIDYDKNVPGLVDFLVDNTIDWKKNTITPFEKNTLNILLSGALPPNPLNLINNGNIDILLDEAKTIYDYIIIDSAPTLLVADTKSLISKSDILLFLTRCNVTEKDILNHIYSVSKENEAVVGVILNGVGAQNKYGYSYGYQYGYGYKYTYNYGYGYGYKEDES